MSCRTLLCFLCLSLSGCATCREHPAVCSVAAAVVVGSVVATLDAHERASPPTAQRTILPVTCNKGECL